MIACDIDCFTDKNVCKIKRNGEILKIGPTKCVVQD